MDGKGVEVWEVCKVRHELERGGDVRTRMCGAGAGAESKGGPPCCCFAGG